MHSPFVFDFIQNVLNNKSGYQLPHEIRMLRRRMKQDRSAVPVHDLGAGSRAGNGKLQTVSHIAGTSVKPEKYASLMHRLAKHYRPGVIVELGTSLGLTTASLAAAVPDAEIITIEGNPGIAEIASSNLRGLGYSSVKTITGDFDDKLPRVLGQTGKIDLGFIDGNHRYAPTMNYFRQMLSRSGTATILVFDDIHWSAEMERAWQEICDHPSVTCTIDIFFLGFVFFREEFLVKQNFRVRF